MIFIFTYCTHHFPSMTCPTDNIFKATDFLMLQHNCKKKKKRLHQIIAVPNLGDFEFYFLEREKPQHVNNNIKTCKQTLKIFCKERECLNMRSSQCFNMHYFWCLLWSSDSSQGFLVYRQCKESITLVSLLLLLIETSH